MSPKIESVKVNEKPQPFNFTKCETSFHQASKASSSFNFNEVDYKIKNFEIETDLRTYYSPMRVDPKSITEMVPRSTDFLLE